MLGNKEHWAAKTAAGGIASLASGIQRADACNKRNQDIICQIISREKILYAIKTWRPSPIRCA
jgi:hypothetical protein